MRRFANRLRLAFAWDRTATTLSPAAARVNADLDQLEVSTGLAEAPPAVASLPLAGTRELWLLAVALALAFAFRCSSLDAVGFAEDETDIARAVESYQRFDFSANAEHPMLAKLAAYGSVELATGWNAMAPRLHAPSISPETALRAPAAIAGALATLAIFLLGSALFDRRVGAWASLLWALDVNATAINRLAKEDSLLVLFLLAAAWLYERGKQDAPADPARAHRWYMASAAGFGLMLASKYMPHYFGLNALAQHISRRGTPGPRWGRFFLVMGGAFLAVNLALFLPASWSRLARYVHEATVIHTGYYYAHHVYVSAVSATPWGLPFSFYLVFLATKLPLAVIVAICAGATRMIRLPRHRGWVFARVFLVLTLLPFSLLAAKYTRYLLPLLAVLDLVAAGGVVWILEQAETRLAGWRRAAAVALAAGFFLAGPFYAQISAWPFAGLSQNVVGARIAPPGWFFPDDEFYDAGVRETVRSIAAVAAPGAVVMSDATGVVDQYLRLAGRSDVRSLSLSHDRLPPAPTGIWMIVQDAHVYFENQGVIEQVRRRLRPSFEIRAAGVIAAQAYRFR